MFLKVICIKVGLQQNEGEDDTYHLPHPLPLF